MPGAPREDAIRITVRRDGQIYFHDERIMLQDLPEEIRQRVRNGAEKRIYLSMDARAKYGETIAVLDQIRLAGIEKVSVLTQEPSR
jgi:biopolymer transport protein ExbD